MTVASNDQLLKPKAFIDGSWIDTDDGSTADVVTPATGEVVAAVPMLGQAETERAIAPANGAFRSRRKQNTNEHALSRAAQTLRDISGLEVISQKAKVEGGKFTEYRATIEITFILEG